ncbi:hypothetical protein ACFOZ1_14110 [Gracilibacillus marinus]|uniref:DUF3139 domain-containing protein n=1 Tax=Gracilibacillus marinus TaxID=630535 RepID=A0ABV8W1H0_9BACI
MKKIIFGVIGTGIFLLVVMLIPFLFDSKETNQLPLEMIAFNSLTDEEQSLIPVSPKDSIIEELEVNDKIRRMLREYEKDTLYSITFNNTETDTTGLIVVYLSLDKETVLWKGFVDSKENK